MNRNINTFLARFEVHHLKGSWYNSGSNSLALLMFRFLQGRIQIQTFQIQMPMILILNQDVPQLMLLT